MTSSLHCAHLEARNPLGVRERRLQPLERLGFAALPRAIVTDDVKDVWLEGCVASGLGV